MVDRDERRLLVEAVDRVAALAHHLVEERLGLAERVLRRVDEAGLGVVPLVGVLLARCGAERADVELVAGLGAVGQLVLGVPAVLAALGPADGAVPFGAEPLLQLGGVTVARRAERQREDDEQRPRRR